MFFMDYSYKYYNMILKNLQDIFQEIRSGLTKEQPPHFFMNGAALALFGNGDFSARQSGFRLFGLSQTITLHHRSEKTKTPPLQAMFLFLWWR